MRPTPPAISLSNSCGARAAECSLAAFRRLPHVDELPSEQAILSRQHVRLCEVVLSNGSFLTASMADGRLHRSARLHLKVMDGAGQGTPIGLVGLEPKHVVALAEACELFLARAQPVQGLYSQVKRRWQGEPEGEAA